MSQRYRRNADKRRDRCILALKDKMESGYLQGFFIFNTDRQDGQDILQDTRYKDEQDTIFYPVYPVYPC